MDAESGFSNNGASAGSGGSLASSDEQGAPRTGGSAPLIAETGARTKARRTAAMPMHRGRAALALRATPTSAKQAR